MLTSIRFSPYEFSKLELEHPGLNRVHNEVRSHIDNQAALLPVHYRGRNVLMTWGGTPGSGLPETKFCRKDSLLKGRWQWLHPVEVLVIASAACSNGVWFHVRTGIRAIMVKDKHREPHVYILTEEATHYFKTMTRDERMPCLKGQLI